MASQNLTETNEYENLLTSINNLDEENEPFTYGAGGWTVIKPQLRLSKKNPWYKVLMNLGNALETGNLSYNQKRILLHEYEKQFKTKTKCGEGSIKRAKEGEEPRELDRRKHGTDLCDLIGWNINGLAELYTPIELLNNELNELKNEDIGKPLSKKNSWRNSINQNQKSAFQNYQKRSKTQSKTLKHNFKKLIYAFKKLKSQLKKYGLEFFLSDPTIENLHCDIEE